MVKAGRMVNGLTVTGVVPLEGANVKHPLSCHGCHFDDQFLASGANFHGIVDFRGSTFSKKVDFSDASFAAPALFGSPQAARGVMFSRSVDFSLATFHDLATFENSCFQGPKGCSEPINTRNGLYDTEFELARFDAGATFASDAVYGDADFERASFAGAADFSGTNFYGDSVFQGVEFAGPVDFGKDNFFGLANFQNARLDKGATFVAAMLSAPPPPVPKHPRMHPPPKCARIDQLPPDSFVLVQSGGTVDFSFATLDRGVWFNNMVVNGGMIFHGATLPPCPVVAFDEVAATSLEMDVSEADKAIASTELTTVLGDIESSAKARGDLGTANDADYERKVLESQHRGWLGYALDVVFYRTIAGYLVRPLQPLAALLILAALMTLVHTGRKAWPHPAATSRGARNRLKSQIGRVRRILPPLGNAYLQTLALVVPGKGPSADERPARWLEVVAYRLLFVCFLIGVANSNPTLRQMLDAIH
jgi:uncharacterized protein YjbI with pentapeptide repeats